MSGSYTANLPDVQIYSSRGNTDFVWRNCFPFPARTRIYVRGSTSIFVPGSWSCRAAGTPSLVPRTLPETRTKWCQRGFWCSSSFNVCYVPTTDRAKNATSVRKLLFVEGWGNTLPPTQQARWAMREVTQLLKCHVPGVRQVKICCGRVHWDDFEKGPFKLVRDRLKSLKDRGNKSSYINES